MVRLSGLWKQVMADGGVKLTGNLGTAKIVILPNTNKTSPTDADYILYVAERPAVAATTDTTL